MQLSHFFRFRLLSLDQMTDHLVFGVDSVICKERGVFDSLLMSVVVREFCEWQLITPVVLLIVDVRS